VTRLTTCADADAVAARAARDIARHLKHLRTEHDLTHVALSGGTTPTRTYELLAREPVDWDGVAIWFADERCVEPTDAQSNYRLARETLLAAAAIPPERVHRMEGELGPLQGAQRYSAALATYLPAGEGDLPVLDLVVLGIGPDGHVASLFPGAATLDAGDEALCLGVQDSPKPPAERITLSLAMLRAARRCLLLATGASKADAVNAMLAQPSRSVPASLLRRERLAVIVDDAACPMSLRS
jgi:6-phosphogluconolactonase